MQASTLGTVKHGTDRWLAKKRFYLQKSIYIIRDITEDELIFKTKKLLLLTLLRLENASGLVRLIIYIPHIKFSKLSQQ